MITTTITGELCPTNPATITPLTAYEIEDAIEQCRFSGLTFKKEGWEQGIVKLDTTLKLPTEELLTTTVGGKLFTVAILAQFIHIEALNELGLQGVITHTIHDDRLMTTETSELILKNGAVIFQG